MSSEPGDSVEAGIVPLVFALFTLAAVTPYWSCEGHPAPDGTIARTPQVWFWSRSQVAPHVVGDALWALYFRRVTSVEWVVATTHSPRGPLEPAYAIRPDLRFVKTADLARLQGDDHAIADALADTVRELARRYLDLAAEVRPAA